MTILINVTCKKCWRCS